MKLSALALIALVFSVAFVAANHYNGNDDNQGDLDRVYDSLHRLGLVTSPFPTTTQTVTVYGPDSRVNGVSVECRQLWMRKTIVVEMNGQNTLCPRGAFGAIIVNHTAIGPYSDSQGLNCGAIEAWNDGTRAYVNDPTAHSEINAIQHLSAQHPGTFIAFNKPFWAPLSMYTNGESCPMDAAAEVWAGIREQIYAVSIKHLIALNWTQIDMPSQYVYHDSGFMPGSPRVIIAGVDFDYQAPYFGWQLISAGPCPTGCHRVGTNCVDNVPFVPIPFP
jgi:tRNA(Arg) A34 adenosine deaminase TadA